MPSALLFLQPVRWQKACSVGVPVGSAWATSDPLPPPPSLPFPLVLPLGACLFSSEDRRLSEEARASGTPAPLGHTTLVPQESRPRQPRLPRWAITQEGDWPALPEAPLCRPERTTSGSSEDKDPSRHLARNHTQTQKWVLCLELPVNCLIFQPAQEQKGTNCSLAGSPCWLFISSKQAMALESAGGSGGTRPCRSQACACLLSPSCCKLESGVLDQGVENRAARAHSAWKARPKSFEAECTGWCLGQTAPEEAAELSSPAGFCLSPGLPPLEGDERDMVEAIGSGGAEL